jgi:xanthine dehydrogenase accessory factor
MPKKDVWRHMPKEDVRHRIPKRDASRRMPKRAVCYNPRMKKSTPRSRSVRSEQDLYPRLAGLLERRVPVVLVTVIQASGSAPGKAGAKMIVTANELHGTVGGGRVEKAALEHARELLGGPAGPETVRYDVVQDLGMSCGGSMTVLYEPLTPPPRLVIFGAGHVSQALCAVASVAGFDVTVCDEREDWLTEDRFPAAQRRVQAGWEEAVDRAEIDDETFVASITPGHAFDTLVVETILKRGLAPRYLGVIGSRRKAAVLRKGLVESGVAQETADRIHIPMGLNIGAADPREIAVSVAAELVAELRGVERIEPW